jgi:hypothetical protein
MSVLTNVNGVFHHIRAKLYPNYLPNGGALIAKTANDALLSVEEVCAAMKDRGGYTGNYNDLVANVKRFFDEAVYQLCDGFGISTDYFSLQPNIGGTFNSFLDPVDIEKHPITFRFRPRLKLRNLIEHILIEIDGEANKKPFIDKFIDHRGPSVNTMFSRGGIFSIYGYRIKVSENDPLCGVFFVPVDDPSAAVRVSDIAHNSRSRIIGTAPDTGFELNRIEIRTRYTGSHKTPLKELRIITSHFVIEAV